MANWNTDKKNIKVISHERVEDKRPAPHAELARELCRTGRIKEAESEYIKAYLYSNRKTAYERKLENFYYAYKTKEYKSYFKKNIAPLASIIVLGWALANGRTDSILDYMILFFVPCFIETFLYKMSYFQAKEEFELIKEGDGTRKIIVAFVEFIIKIVLLNYGVSYFFNNNIEVAYYIEKHMGVIPDIIVVVRIIVSFMRCGNNELFPKGMEDFYI